MEFYQITNDQPIPEDRFFWKYSDIKRRSPWTRMAEQSKSPVKKKETPMPSQKIKEAQELSECTFKPQTISNNDRYWHEGYSGFLSRCQQWQEQKHSKLMRQRLNEVESNLKECTFQPRITYDYQFKPSIVKESTKPITTKPVSVSPMKPKVNKPVYKYGDALNYLHKQLHS